MSTMNRLQLLLLLLTLADHNVSGEENCTVCVGNTAVDESLAFGNTPCGEWWSFARQTPSLTEECTLQRAAGAQFCGCTSPSGGAYETCYLCGDETSNANVNVQVGKPIPDSPVDGLTCGDLLRMPMVDPETCPLLQEKYQTWCGCPDAPVSSCPFCEATGAEPNLEISYPFADVTPVDANCKGLYDFFQVQTSASCPIYRQNLATSFLMDMPAYCQCPEQEAPAICGASYCPTGEGIATNVGGKVMDEYFGITCNMFPQITSYIAAQEDCAFVEESKDMCCESVNEILILTAPPGGDGGSSSSGEATFQPRYCQGLSIIAIMVLLASL